MPWRPSTRNVELLPTAALPTAGSSASAPPLDACEDVPRPATRSRQARAAGAGAGATAPAVRRVLAGGSRGSPAMATLASIPAAAAHSRSVVSALTRVPATSAAPAVRTTGSGVRAPVEAAAGLATAPSRVALFSTLPVSPRVLKESADLQPWMTRMIPLVDISSFAATWEDGHQATSSIGTRKPDNVHHPILASRSRYTVTYLGDNKSQNESGAADFSDDAVAHITDFLFAQAALQRWRHQFIGYLLDGKNIAFFVACFGDSPTRGGPRPLVRCCVSENCVRALLW